MPPSEGLSEEVLKAAEIRINNTPGLTHNPAVREMLDRDFIDRRGNQVDPDDYLNEVLKLLNEGQDDAPWVKAAKLAAAMAVTSHDDRWEGPRGASLRDGHITH